ncbi:DUF6221 family protein [Streptomyces sp. NPDC050738]|uniref:DUF6221 family protein n=1 Tax=Streptomyces sp. NPDC050738 TaxID=3154744 RepID=UPI00343305DB
MSDALTEFLRARIAEDDRAAMAASSMLPWVQGEDPEGSPTFVIQGEYGSLAIECPAAADAVHIARHTPSRVLAEVQAKRRVLARHVLSPANGETETPWDNVDDCQYDGDNWPCPDLLDIALPYADHAEYRDEWRVT